MKSHFTMVLALLAMASFTSCKTTTRVVEVTPPPVVVKPKPVPSPTPAQFKVVNQYDFDQR
ncbi:MAG: hypothetical protein JNM99_03690 [Verrucomicrobiaceae bacterium]|nr:hypothetical protein [Verrucomicrobiaceae bacterium]